MIVLLGSGSGQKVDILRRALTTLTEPGFDLQFYDVPSGITEQPLDRETTRLGSENRARHAAADYGADYDLSFGMEAGLEWADGIYSLVCAVTILDRGGNLSTGMSEPQPLPHAVSAAVRAGAELGEVIREYYQQLSANSADLETVRDLVDRERGFRAAIADAWQQREAHKE